jgi:hypothetical protein
MGETLYGCIKCTCLNMRVDDLKRHLNGLHFNDCYRVSVGPLCESCQIRPSKFVDAQNAARCFECAEKYIMGPGYKIYFKQEK